MGLTLLTAPVAEPITLTDTKLHLREESAAQDALITSLIVAVRGDAEGFTRRAFLTQTWRLSIDGFPCSGIIRLPMPPLVSVTSIKYTDLAGAEQTLAANQYVVDVASLPGRIHRAYDITWPSTRPEANCVRVEFVCGFGDAAAVPEGIKAAMKLFIGHLYENREAINIGDIVNEIPMGYQALLWPHRVLEVV